MTEPVCQRCNLAVASAIVRGVILCSKCADLERAKPA